MKIGIDIRSIGKKRTGDEAVFFNLVKNLARIDSGHNFELFTDIVDKEILQEISQDLGIIEKDNFKIISLPTKNKFSWNFWTLPRYLRKNPVDIYLTQYITPFFVPRSVKIVTIVHDISFNFFPQFIKFSDLFFLKILIPLSLKRADRIIGVSQFTRNEIIKFYKTDPEKVDYIYNAVGDDFLKGEVSFEEKERVRKKYKLPEKFILYLGTLQPRKNIPHLIEAFARIKDRLEDAKLVICGNLKAHNCDMGIEKSVAVNNLGNEVFFPGFIDEKDKVAVFAQAQAFVFPSLYEGFGIPPLEAMSQGVPVLLSEIPSLKEISANGALYASPFSVDEFAEMIYDINKDENLRNKLIQAGFERVGFFSWQKTAESVLVIFEKIRHNKEIDLK
ncbi:MAG: glycosyltransferase family 4 protein [Candidatus Moranbacteria bacterium]|nr:glycosyltransferase family 4 protein [Candidatus Moranbacteria bacterium]